MIRRQKNKGINEDIWATQAHLKAEEGSGKMKQSQEAERMDRSIEQSLAGDRRDGNKGRLLQELTKERSLP